MSVGIYLKSNVVQFLFSRPFSFPRLDFSRNFSHCNASLKVNDSLALSGDQSTWLGKVMSKAASATADDRPIILNTWLHLGGAPQAPIGLISALPGASTGFTGCLHSLRINGRKRDLFG